MGLVQYFVTVPLLCAQLVLTSPLLQRMHNGRSFEMCPAGEYLKRSGTECEPCPAGSFTAAWNRDNSCERCFGDCRSDYHLRVVQNCTSTSNIKCVCEVGFTCSDVDQYTGNCRLCEKIHRKNNSSAVAAAPGNNKQIPPAISSGHSSTSAKPCQHSKCDSQSDPSTPNEDTTRSQLAAILCPVVVMVCLALVILFCVQQSRDGACFKRAITKLRDEGRQASASFKSKESSQFPRDSFSAKQQPPSVSAASLGPVHFHNPGTVIFSLLSQFTGQVGTTVVGEKMTERAGAEEDNRTESPVCHPSSSPSLHLSEEERSAESDSIFFPSQEQGKDCHMSKEEEL
ncbi:tumor necrosis factor receptor superfamily member 5-like [Solea senegalensis]|uniref:Tumor necrosis factor receptor superfamily member 5-like n=1 Tax=Solea senegalensis TaxID=28829 RepID=A0AAV6PSW5_SOLSE|nr:tumor necrosis factor receptor superfamily member 14 isoform X1 [Solea senegalensis]KAG7475008.1 tumor necrosis factor receptor superfamily member 5-like [Solea senegalensis]